VKLWSIILVTAAVGGCSTYTIEHRKRPAYLYATQKNLPQEEIREDGTIVEYSTITGDASPMLQEYMAGIELRTEDEETGEVTLRAILPEHLLQHLLICLRERDWELLFEQVLSAETHDAYAVQEQGRAKFDLFFETNRRELARTVQRMLKGKAFGDVLMQDEGRLITMTFAPSIRGSYRYRVIELVRDGEFLRLRIIR
jgi:hypothetical protein